MTPLPPHPVQGTYRKSQFYDFKKRFTLNV